MTSLRRSMTLGLLACSTLAVATAQEPSRQYQNLHVLPHDISPDELAHVMIGNLRGLGLPRRQNQGCLHCHVGDMDRPSDTWDWASDAKPAKLKARTMMAMVDAINREYLAKLDSRVDPPVKVTCYTCHAGRTDPRPLPDVLEQAYRGGGVGSAVARYRELRGRYFGGDAYDFRVDVLSGMAFHLAGRGAFDDAITLAELNAEAHPEEPSARRTWLQLRLGGTYEKRGTEAVLSEFDAMLDSESIDPAVLDGFGWGLDRRDRQADALAVFRHNLRQFPDEYIPNESLADALWFRGERESAIKMFEAWLERHPDHEMARRRLAKLRSRL